MRAGPIIKERVDINDDFFTEVVVWQVPEPVKGSDHEYKYRLALVFRGECVLRYDNEAGKGDHRHVVEGEAPYTFTTLEALLADFRSDVRRFMK